MNDRPTAEQLAAMQALHGGRQQDSISDNLLTSVCQLLEELLAETKHVRAALAASGSISSVEVRTSTRGVDVACKAYAGSDIQSAGDAAKAEYLRVVAALNNETNMVRVTS